MTRLEDLRSEVIAEIERDIASGDHTALHELLEFIPVDYLLGYLQDEISAKFK